MSDGQFSSKPMRSGPIREVNRSTGEFAEGAVSSGAARDFLHSQAVRHEVNKLLEEQDLDFGHFSSAPLPRHTPEGARKLGQPLASATLVQEYLIGLVFLRIAGWVFMAFALLFVVAAVITFITAIFAQGPEAPPVFASGAIALIGLAIGVVGAWFGIFRGRVIMEMCWFCDNGMIWMINGSFDWYRWEDIPDVFCNLQANRPAIGISFRRNVSWISFSNTKESRRVVTHIEKLASAACVENVLQLISDGKAVRFGAWSLSRTSVRGPDSEIAWENVLDLDCGPYDVCIVQRGSGRTVVPLEEVPFPSMFTAMARAVFVYSRGETR